MVYKMKRRILILFVGILLVGLVTAGVLLSNLTSNVDPGNKAVLESMNIGENIQLEKEVCINIYDQESGVYLRKECHNEIETTNLEVTDTQVGDRIRRCLYQKKGINKCEYFEGDNSTARDIWQENFLNDIANDDTLRKSRSEVEIGRGNVIISEK